MEGKEKSERLMGSLTKFVSDNLDEEAPAGDSFKLVDGLNEVEFSENPLTKIVENDFGKSVGIMTAFNDKEGKPLWLYSKLSKNPKSKFMRLKDAILKSKSHKIAIRKQVTDPNNPKTSTNYFIEPL